MHQKNSCLFLLGAVLIGVYGSDVFPKNDLDKYLLNLLQLWRKGDVAAFPFPVLPLELIEMPGLEGEYKGKGVKLSYSTSELLVSGVSNFTVVELNATEANMEASGIFHFSQVKITADNYKLNGRAYLLYPLKGSGKMEIKINDIDVMFTIRLAANGTSTYVDEFQFDFYVEKIQADLDGSSWPINKVLNREGVKILDGYHDSIVEITRHNMINHLNKYLITMTPAKLLSAIAESYYLCL